MVNVGIGGVIVARERVRFPPSWMVVRVPLPPVRPLAGRPRDGCVLSFRWVDPVMADGVVMWSVVLFRGKTVVQSGDVNMPDM